MPFDYRNFQQKSRRHKSGKGHQKPANYHATGKQSIRQKNKYSMLRSSKRSRQRSYNGNNTVNTYQRYLQNDKSDTSQDLDSVKWHHCNVTKSSIGNELKGELPDYIKQRLSHEIDFKIHDYYIDFKISFARMQQNKPKQKRRVSKRKKKHSKSFKTRKNRKFGRINQLETYKQMHRYNFDNMLMILINTIGENIFFDIICKKFLYPWEIANLCCLCKEFNCLITSYDSNHSYFKHLFSDTNNMVQYISGIRKTIETVEIEEWADVCMFQQLIIDIIQLFITLQ